MGRVSWIQNGSNYNRVEGAVSNVDTVPVGVYDIYVTMMGGWYLHHSADAFTFDYKIYGIEQKFIEHVMTAYENTKGNFGILLNGTKGTGKSVTAKILANKLNLPIIIVKGMGDKNSSMFDFMKSFNFDCVFFLDEFEKNFNKEDSNILQIMDGVYTSQYRRIFLLTTNEPYINDNLISRPSRLRYVHEFSNLSQDIVKEYLNDNLKDMSKIDDVIAYVDTLSISTIDILKAITEEINIFGYDKFMETRHYFNVKTMHFYYNIEYIRMTSSWAVENKYTVQDFLSDIKKSKAQMPDGPLTETEEERRKRFIKFRIENKPKVTNFSLSSAQIACESSWKRLKPGNGFWDDTIIKVDHTHGVIITEENGILTYQVILNPEEKPSLYKPYEGNFNFLY